MSNFNKILTSVVLFVSFVFSFSIAPLCAFFNSEFYYFMDKNARLSLVGQLDFFIIGSSNGMCAYDCSIIDEKLNCKSYNLSGPDMSMDGMNYLLNQELNRNKVQTVILDVNSENMTYNKNDNNAIGEIYNLFRINGFGNRFLYFFKNIYPKNYLSAYSKIMNLSYEYILSQTENTYEGKVNYSQKGQYNFDCNNIFLSNDEILNSKDSQEIELDYLNRNEQKLISTIKMCINKGCKVILITSPQSRKFMWQNSGLNFYHSIYQAIADKYNCLYIDANLLKIEYAKINDKVSFSDYQHMSEIGAKEFSNIICDIIIKSQSGEDISDMFYSSYDEAIKHFEYYEIYQSMLKEQS